MTKWVLIVCAGIAGFFPAMLFAEDKEPGAWSQEAELAYILKRGNTVSDTLQGKYNAAKETERWRHTAKLEGSNTRAYDEDTKRNKRTGERYFGSYKLDRILESNNNYIYNVVTYDDDNFSGFEYQAGYSVGYGRRLINSDTKELDVEIGPGYRIKRYEHGYADEQALINFWIASGYDDQQTLIQKQINEDGPYEKGKEEHAVLRLASKFKWQINPNVRFLQDISTEAGRYIANSRSETSLTARINGSLSFRVAHLIKHNSRVPEGKKEADHETTVSLVYSF